MVLCMFANFFKDIFLNNNSDYRRAKTLHIFRCNGGEGVSRICDNEGYWNGPVLKCTGALLAVGGDLFKYHKQFVHIIELSYYCVIDLFYI